jgi:hypothetical protein
VKTRWGLIGPVSRLRGGRDRPTSRNDSLGVDGAGYEVGGGRNTAQRVVKTRWGLMLAVWVMETAQRAVKARWGLWLTV